MTIAVNGTGATSQSKTAGTTVAAGAGGTYAIGSYVFVLVALDNTGTGADGDYAQVTSVTDAGGNTYVKESEFSNTQAAAAGGATISLWKSQLTTALAFSNLVTANHGSVTARAISILNVTVGAGNTLAAAGTIQTRADDAADPGSLAISGLSSAQHFFIRGTAYESAVLTITKTASFDGSNGIATSGGGSATNMGLAFEWLVATNTGATSDIGLSATSDNASVLAGYVEVAGGTTVALTGQSVTGAVGSLLAVAALALSGGSLTASRGSVLPGAPLTGQSATVAQGSASPNVTVALTGQSLSVAQGTIIGGLQVTGQSTTVAQGSTVAGTTIALTGQSLTAARGSVAGSSSPALSGQSLAAAQGAAVASPSFALSGQSLSSARGTLSPTTSPALSGQGLTAASGSVGPSLALAISGQTLSIGEGSVTVAAGDITIALSGQALSLAQGSFGPAISTAITGQSLAPASGSILPADITLTLGGQGISITQGNPASSAISTYKFWRQPALVGRRTNPGRSR